MEGLRIVEISRPNLSLPCSRCGNPEHTWDRVGDSPYCPGCQESIAMGEGSPLMERTLQRPCAACLRTGTVRFQTLPLGQERAVEMDLCPDHLRSLLSRRLTADVFRRLTRGLLALEVHADEIFLLHDEFYDEAGEAIYPITDPE